MKKILFVLLILFSCSKSDDSVQVAECVCTKTVYKLVLTVVCDPACHFLEDWQFQYTEPALCQDETPPDNYIPIGGGLYFRITCE